MGSTWFDWVKIGYRLDTHHLKKKNGNAFGVPFTSQRGLMPCEQ